MSDPNADAAVAKIRPYKDEDRKLVLFMVGKSNMEMLAQANNKTYFHPLTLAIWIALSSVFIQVMKWWPSNEFGFWSYLKPLPAFASTAVPIMFFADWINRPYFEDLTQKVVKQGDLVDIPKHYSQSPASGLWILEYGNTYVGFVAIDASQPSSKNTKQIKGKKEKEQGKDQSPKSAVIRHLHVDEMYRSVGVQADLLQYAVDHAFKADPKLERIEVADSPLLAYLRPTFRAMGFELNHHTEKVGILGWSLGVRYLERERWTKSQK